MEHSLESSRIHGTWRETVRVIEDVAPQHCEQILAATAVSLYGLDPAVAAVEAPS
jgi:hypothetical protein